MVKQRDSIHLGEIGLENYAPYLMNRIMGRFNTTVQQDTEAQGLSTPIMRTLAVLSVIDGIRIRELAVYAVVEQSTLSRVLDKMQTSGLIRREKDAQDSRATRVFSTPDGQAAFKKVWPLMEVAYAQMVRGVSEAEQKAFISVLQKMLANIRHHEL